MSSIKKVICFNLRQFAKCTIVVCGAISFALAPAAVLAQNAPDNDPVAIYKEAGINPQQESAIRALAEQYDRSSTSELQSLAQMLEELRSMAYQKTLNEPAMLSKQEEINKLQSRMSLEKIKLVIKIRGMLSPEQNEKLVNLLQNRARAEEQMRSR